MEIADGSLGLLPSLMGAHQVRSIQRKAGGEGMGLPPSSPEHSSDCAVRHAGMSFEDVEVGKVYEGRVVGGVEQLDYEKMHTLTIQLHEITYLMKLRVAWNYQQTIFLAMLEENSPHSKSICGLAG